MQVVGEWERKRRPALFWSRPGILEFSVNSSGVKQKSRFETCYLHKLEKGETAGTSIMPIN